MQLRRECSARKGGEGGSGLKNYGGGGAGESFSRGEFYYEKEDGGRTLGLRGTGKRWLAKEKTQGTASGPWGEPAQKHFNATHHGREKSGRTALKISRGGGSKLRGMGRGEEERRSGTGAQK